MQAELPSLARAVAIINLVLGSIGLLSSPCGGLMFFDKTSTNPVVKLVRDDPTLFAWEMSSLALGVLLISLQIIGAAALLKRIPWGRTLLFGQSIAVIVKVVISALVTALVLTPRLLEMAHRLPDSAQKAGAIGGAIGGAFGSLFALVLPILTLIAVTRPDLRAALAPPPGGTAAPYPPSL